MVELLSLSGFARRLGLAPGTVRRYYADGRLPEPDGVLSDGADVRHYGWSADTVDNWRRPGQGARTDLQKSRADRHAKSGRAQRISAHSDDNS